MIVSVEGQTTFEDFYRAERTGILRALAFTLGDADLAAEATDEGFVRAVERWDVVAAMASPGGWVYRVGLNWSRNRLRRRRLERRKAPPPPRPVEAEPVLRDPALAAALAELSIDHRAIVVARYYLDLSVEETAAFLEVPAGTVKSRLNRALHRLESILEERS